MTRTGFALLALLLASGLYLVRVSYDARRLYTEVDRAQNEERRLDTEFEQLKAEKQAQATSLRVEKTARERLGMRNATPPITQYVTFARPASAAQGVAP